MIAPPAGMRIYLACGVTDMRKGMVGLSMLVQQTLKDDPFDGAVFAFRGRRAGLIKLIWHDGIGLCMLTKRLEHGQFVWPSADTIGRIMAAKLTRIQRELGSLAELAERRRPAEHDVGHYRDREEEIESVRDETHREEAAR